MSQQSRREFLKTSLGFGGGLLLNACAGLQNSFKKPANTRRPDIIFFFTDQQRWDSSGCYGLNPMNLTPELDAMAAEGVQFTHAFTCQPVCGPARSCLQTGCYATSTGCWKNGIGLRRDERTVAHLFKEAGYDTAYIGKWHLADDGIEPVPRELQLGYDYWMASNVLEFTSHPYEGKVFDKDGQPHTWKDQYRSDVMTDHALNYIRQHDAQKPYFMFLSFIEPHHQNDMKRFLGPREYAERYKDCWVPEDVKAAKGDWPENLPDYYGMIRRLDENLGRLRAELKRRGTLDNTLIVFTSDHGCHFRTRGDQNEYKRSCHEASIRVPLVMAGPGFSGGRKVDELVSLVDLPPTIITAGGAEVPASMQGRDVLPLLQGTATDWPEEVFVQISEAETGRAIRTRRWKYSVTAPGLQGWEGPASAVYDEDYLYDLEADPHEQRNLVRVPELAAVRAELAERLKKRMTQAGESIPEIRPAVRGDN